MQMFKRFHTAYVDAVSNPFYTTSTVSGHVVQLAHISGSVLALLQMQAHVSYDTEHYVYALPTNLCAMLSWITALSPADAPVRLCYVYLLCDLHGSAAGDVKKI